MRVDQSISAIIVSYRTGPELWACLDAAIDAPDVDGIVIVDNGNPEQVSARLRALAAARRDVWLVQGHGNIGFAAGANLGASAARSAHLLFLNPDAVLAPGAARALRDAAADAPRPCVIGGMLRDGEGREARGARRGQVTPWSAFVSLTGLARLEPLSPLFADVNRMRDIVPAAPTPVAAVSGAFMLIPRADFDTLGGFDRDYFLHVEDIDICKRAAELGGGAVFQPRAIADHVGATSDAPAAFVARHKARGFARFFRKQARGPVSRVAAECIGALLLFLLPLRAALKGQARRGDRRLHSG